MLVSLLLLSCTSHCINANETIMAKRSCCSNPSPHSEYMLVFVCIYKQNLYPICTHFSGIGCASYCDHTLLLYIRFYVSVHNITKYFIVQVRTINQMHFCGTGTSWCIAYKETITYRDRRSCVYYMRELMVLYRLV